MGYHFVTTRFYDLTDGGRSCNETASDLAEELAAAHSRRGRPHQHDQRDRCDGDDELEGRPMRQ